MSVAYSAEPLRAVRRRLGLAGAAAAALMLAAPGLAQATTYFTATASAGSTFTVQDVLFHGFSFGDYQVRVTGGCFANCITATAGNGAALGTFNFSMSGSPWSNLYDPVGNPSALSVPAGPNGGFEHFDGFGGVNMLGGDFGNGPALLGGGPNFSGFSIYATAGQSTATIEFDLDQFVTSQVLTLPNAPLYLQITGATATPVGVSNITPDRMTPVYTFDTPMTWDFTMVLTDTPFTPTTGGGGGGGGGVPEPAAWTLMLLGFVTAGLALRRRRPATATFA